MRSSIFWGIALTSMVIIFGFQNCSQVGFNSQSQLDQSSTSDGSSGSAGLGVGGTGSSGNAQPVVTGCASTGCISNGQTSSEKAQQLFFTNNIGVTLNVQLDQKVSDSESVYLLQNSSSGRKTKVRVRVSANGYFSVSPENPKVPWFCIDSSQNPGAIINGMDNCLSAVVVAGTKQKAYTLSANYREATKAEQTIEQVKSSQACSTTNCVDLPKSGYKFVVDDLWGTNNGAQVVSKVKLSGYEQDRYKITFQDSEGRQITVVLTDPSSGGFDILKHITLFNQNHPGYFCFEPDKAPLAIVKINKYKAGQEAINCFSSLRYHVLNSSFIESIAGSVPFTNVAGGAANTSIWAVGDPQVIGTGEIKP